LARAETVPLELEPGRGVIKRTLRLSTDGKPLDFTPERVDVTVAIEPATLIKEYKSVKVRAKADVEYTVSPNAVYLRLSGPGDLLQNFELGPGEVYLDIDGLAPGDYLLPLSFKLPAEIQLLEHRPQRFRVRIPKPK
jgi:hypothetical protein